MIRSLTPIVVILAAAFFSCKYPPEARFLPVDRGPVQYGLEISFPRGRIHEGESARAAALIIYSDGSKSEAAAADVAWTSGDPETAVIENDGTITGKKMGVCEINAAFGGSTAVCEIEVLRSADYRRIMISEVFYDAAGSDDGKEFIELFNDNEYACDISGMKIVDGAASSVPYVFPDGSFIDAKGYAVVAQSREGVQGLFGYAAPFAGFSFALNNTGETVLFMMADGSLIDRVFIRGGVPENPAPDTWGSALLPSSAAGCSVQRKENRDTDTCEDWTSGPPTPGK